MEKVLHTFEAEYKNKAIIQVQVLDETYKNWKNEEPLDIIRLKMTNKEYLKEPVVDIIVRPDEALTLISLLSEGVHYWMNKQKPSNKL